MRKVWCSMYYFTGTSENWMQITYARPWAPDDPIQEWIIPGTYHE